MMLLSKRICYLLGRLKKQQPISIPDPPGSISGSRSETFVGTTGASIESGQHPIVAVTVHECNSESISHL